MLVLQSKENGGHMTTLTIRNIDDQLKARLRANAAAHDRTVEEEALAILQGALPAMSSATGLASRIRRRFDGLEAGELELPPRAALPRAATLPE
jgi:plasmid stability protein